MGDNFSTDWGGGVAQAVIRVIGEQDDAYLPLTSCCVAWFLTGHRQVPVLGPGAGDPCSSSFPTAASWVAAAQNTGILSLGPCGMLTLAHIHRSRNKGRNGSATGLSLPGHLHL